MNIKKYFLLCRGLVLTLVLVALVGLTFPSPVSFAEISLFSYCQIPIKTLQQDIDNFQELISIANQYKNDPERFAQVEKIKQVEFKESKRALFASFGITAEEYVAYMGKNKGRVDQYLSENPDIKKQIDDLAADVRNLLQEFENLKRSIKEKPPLP